MSNLLISVILVAHNQEKFLTEALQSLRAQTIGIEKLEIILINDASTDATGELFAQFQQQHPNNVKIKTVNFLNVGKTRNAALSLVSAAFLMFLDGDDLLAPNACELLLQTAQSKQSQMVITPLKRFSAPFANKKILNAVNALVFDAQKLRTKLLQHTEYMGHITGVLFNAKLFTGLLFPDFSCYEDVFIAPDLIAKVSKVAWLNCHVYYYRSVINSTSSSLDNHKATCMLKVLEKLKSCATNAKLMRLYQALCVKQCRILLDNVADLDLKNKTILKQIIWQIPIIPFLLATNIRISRKRLFLQNRKEVFDWKK